MPENNKKLFLLDAYALIFRSYYAFIKNPRMTSKGQNTSAVFGFLLTLEEVLRKQKPSHIAVVFDYPGPTFRHELFNSYKANRDATPEDIKYAVPVIKRLLEAYKIPVIDFQGYEADDIIGTMAKKASKKGFTTYMMTPDKDFAQLVTDNIFMYKPSRSGNDAVQWGVDDVKREFSIEKPEQVIDILALMGDSSDNIPGAPGIGPKTAKKLISEYGSVEELFKHTDELKGKLKEIIVNNKDQIKLSKELATIIVDVPVDFDEKQLIKETPDIEKLEKLFDELEFKTIAEKIIAENRKEISGLRKNQLYLPDDSYQTSLFSEQEENLSSSSKKTIEDTEHKYYLLIQMMKWLIW
jgi:DNA polymerase-1